MCEVYFFFICTATTDIYTYKLTLSLHDALPIYTGVDEQAAGYFQNSEIDDNILLPPARPQDDDPERTWSRDFFAVAVGVLNTPQSNGSANSRTLPAFYFRGRHSGYSFSTRSTHLQLTLIRPRRGHTTTLTFAPTI